jgi:hypothetical protein
MHPFFASLFLAATLAACASEPAVERRGADSPAQLAAVFPMRPELARERLLEGLADALAGSRFPGFEIAASDDPIFPDPAQQRLNSEGNPALARYAELPPEAKALDLYLHDPLDRYWASEYTIDGVPVKFRCDFIVHMEKADGGTRVEVIEYLPRVWPRDHFQLLGNHGPGRYRDIRKVEPTVRDREEMLAAVRAALAAKP